VVLPSALGWCGFAAGLVGFACAWRHHRPSGVLLVSTAAAFFGLVGPLRLQFVRYASPLAMLLSFGLGVALTVAWVWTRERWGASRAAVVLTFACVLCLAGPTQRALAFDHLLSLEDTRELARAWVLAHANGRVIDSEGDWGYLHGLQSSALQACRQSLPPALFHPEPVLAGQHPGWPTWVGEGPTAWGDMAAEALTTVKKQLDSPLRVQARATLPCGEPAQAEGLRPTDPACFHEVAHFSPGAPACGVYMDRFDRFYLPYSGFDGQERAGPDIHIYEGSCAR
jgi:hypothetical protein